MSENPYLSNHGKRPVQNQSSLGPSAVVVRPNAEDAVSLFLHFTDHTYPPSGIGTVEWLKLLNGGRRREMRGNQIIKCIIFMP